VNERGKNSLSSESNPLPYFQSTQVLSELFHSLRTPLGVALTVTRDAQRGFELAPSDLEDSARSLERIKGYLDELRPLLGLSRLELRELSIEELSLLVSLEGFELVTREKAGVLIKVESELIKIWLQQFRNSTVLTLEKSAEDITLSINFNSLDAVLQAPSSTFLKLLEFAFLSVGSNLSYSANSTRLTIPANYFTLPGSTTHL